MRLKDRIALITGAGSGIGREAALLFAREGAAVTVVDVAEAHGRETVAKIEAAGGRARFVRADVSRAEDARAMIACLIDTLPVNVQTLFATTTGESAVAALCGEGQDR